MCGYGLPWQCCRSDQSCDLPTQSNKTSKQTNKQTTTTKRVASGYQKHKDTFNSWTLIFLSAPSPCFLLLLFFFQWMDIFVDVFCFYGNCITEQGPVRGLEYSERYHPEGRVRILQAGSGPSSQGVTFHPWPLLVSEKPWKRAEYGLKRAVLLLVYWVPETASKTKN